MIEKMVRRKRIKTLFFFTIITLNSNNNNGHRINR